MKHILLVPVLALALSVPLAAKSHKITVTVHSNPEGASLFINTGQVYMGSTPVDIAYEINADCQRTQEAFVRWKSEVTASIAGIDLCASTGKHQEVTFARPVGLPGIDVDEAIAFQAALHRETLARLRAETAAIEERTRAQRRANVYIWGGRLPTPPRYPLICDTRDVGYGTWRTECQ